LPTFVRAHDESTAPAVFLESSMIASRSMIGGARIAPSVVGRLNRYAAGDPHVFRAAANLLTGRQLRGETSLPDPLPAITDRARAVVTSLTAAERRVLLCASVTTDDRVRTLLAATGVDIRVLLSPRLAELVRIHGGRFTRISEPIRAALMATASRAEVREVHRSIARALHAGRDPRRYWHVAGSVTGSDDRLARQLVHLARNRYEAGACETAVRIAAQGVAVSASAECAADAARIAGLASFWAGFPEDAEHWFRRCEERGHPVVTGNGGSALEIVAFVRTSPQAQADPKESARRFIGTICELDPPARDESALRHLARIIETYEQDRAVSDEMFAAFLLSMPPLVSAWPWDPLTPPSYTPLVAAQICTLQAAFHAQAGAFPVAAEAVLRAGNRLPLLPVSWGIIGSIVGAIATSGGVLDPLFAQLFKDLALVPTPAWEIEGEAAGQVTVDATRIHSVGAHAVDHRSVDDVIHDASEGLTRRERQVLSLAIAGLRNEGISAELNISARTVEVHLGNVYRKLKVKSRAELAAVFVRSSRTRA
jgi:DNA-binding CsgD family transcriptional regulator